MTRVTNQCRSKKTHSHTVLVFISSLYLPCSSVDLLPPYLHRFLATSITNTKTKREIIEQEPFNGGSGGLLKTWSYLMFDICQSSSDEVSLSILGLRNTPLLVFLHLDGN